MIEFLQSISPVAWTGLVVGILSLIQIAPIKINPWSWIARQIGRGLNGEVLKNQEEMIKENQEYQKANDLQIKTISQKIDRRDAENCRNRILRFGDEIRNKQIRHSEEYYNQILADITEYNKYCKEHPSFPNERTVATTKIIKQAYEEHLRNNDFL